jgi:Domain of unknown function (DUF4345)
MQMEALIPGLRAPFARLGLRVLLLGVAGLFLFRFGLPGMILGGSWLAGEAVVTAKVDSEARFLSAIATGVGCAALWLVRNFERYPAVGVFIATFALLGGLSRLLSMALFGTPEGPEIVATALEIMIPMAVVALLSQRVGPFPPPSH